MLVAETLTGMPALFVGRLAKTQARIEALEGRDLRLALDQIPAPATEVRVVLQTEERPLGTVQLQGRITSAWRVEGLTHVTVTVHRLFAPTDEDFLVTFLHRFLPDERVLGRQFRATAAGTVYELPAPGSVAPLPPHIRDTLAAHHGYIAHDAEPPPDAQEAPAREPEGDPEPAAESAYAHAEPPPVSRLMLAETVPLRIPLVARLDGIPFRGVAYRATEDGLRCFVVSLGRPPGFGARVALDVELGHGPGDPQRIRLVGAVAWSQAAPPEPTPTTAFALRIGPGTTREAMTTWTEAVHEATRAWRESDRKTDEDLNPTGLPPRGVVKRLEALARQPAPAT
ncbi:MAG: hypothetical protein H6744_08000 [Deltaproteobacteria bacterium]|nr:hypothetical protein [Deltaproteobacteria bacterium]MCB9786622.1 hypothetical protein [Deltaproteobacteria bacterium]